MAKNLQLEKAIGHRGACGHAPENTLASMAKAHALGVGWVEFDVMLAACGTPIVIHDETLHRTTNGKGEVAKTPYQHIALLDAGAWFGQEFAGQRVPTFSELLHYSRQLNLKVNVEIKPTPGKEIATAEAVISLLKQHWPCDSSPPLVSSFSVLSLQTARRIDQEVWLGLNIRHWTKQWRAIADELNCQSVHVNCNQLTAERVAEIQSTGRAVLSYTINELQKAQELFAWGVVAVFSDYPEVILNGTKQR